MKVGIIGAGLIGGSIILALCDRNYELAAVTRNQKTIEELRKYNIKSIINYQSESNIRKVAKICRMTVFEILKFNRELIKRLCRIGFKPEDCRYIDLYDEYERMKRSGDKVTYIVLHLSDKYGVCERKVYDIIKRFGSDCTADAV